MVHNPNTPWRHEALKRTINRMSDAELDHAIADKQKEGYKVTKRYNYYAGYGVRKFVAVLAKI